MTRLARHLLTGCLALTLLCVTPQLWAVEVPTLYTATVPLDQEADDPREVAYSAALAEVLARVSGSELANNPAEIAALFPEPSAFVTQFGRGEADSLIVAFDGEALERVLKRAGYSVWGADRPLTLVWLAVDWGQGNREIIAAEDPDQLQQQSRTADRNRLLRERLLDIAARRGVPIRFPLLDTVDLQEVTFSDIWGGFDERILAASRRYDVRSVLMGRVRPVSGERNRWSYAFGGETRGLSGTPEAVVEQIAALMAAEFAVGGNDPLQRLALQVSGIETVDAYGSLQATLADIAVIEALTITEVSGDTVRYNVEVRGGAARLRRALLFAGLLEQESLGGFGAPTADLEFFFSPDG